MSIIIGIDHGYYAIKTAHCSFPAGLTSYGEHEPYTRQGLLEFGGCSFVCGTGRQPKGNCKDELDNLIQEFMSFAYCFVSEIMKKYPNGGYDREKLLPYLKNLMPAEAPKN